MEKIKEHSDIGASSCERWWNCPGSVALIKKAPEQEKSFAAAEGTGAHELAEKALKIVKTGATMDIYAEIGKTSMVDGHEIEITEEMVDGVIVYLKAISYEASRYGTNYSFLSIEEQFQLDIDKEAWGRNDASLYIPFDRLIIWDLKFGKGIVVEVKDNKQLKYYALGAMKGKDIKEVECVIVQPRAYHPDGPVRKFKYSVEELKEFEKELKVAITRTKMIGAKLHAGEHCKFCPALVICPDVKAEANELAVRDFKNVSTLDLQMMIKLAEMSPRIVDFLKEVERHLQAKAEKGAEVPGFKLVKARSNRKWKSEQRVVNEFIKSKYGGNLMEAAKLKSPSKLDKVFGAERDLLLPFIEKPDNGLTLVRDSDPRLAIKSSATEDFKEIE